MVYRLAYFIDSPHYLHQFSFIRILNWLSSQNQHGTIICTGNTYLQDLVKNLPLERQELIKIVPLSPLDEVKARTGEEIYTELNPLYPSYPEESISISTVIIPDRCVGYVHNQSTESLSDILIKEELFSEIYIIGSGTDSPINNFPIVKKALEKNISIIGFPLGNIVGRYAPFWLKYCEKIFIEDPTQAEQLKSSGFKEEKINIYSPEKLNFQLDSTLSDQIVIDVGIHSPRRDLVTIIKELLKSTNNNQISIYTNQSDSYLDYLNKYTQAQGLPPINITNNLQILFNCNQILSFFPYFSHHLLTNFNIKNKITYIDLNQRYTLIDQLKYNAGSTVYTLDNLHEVRHAQ